MKKLKYGLVSLIITLTPFSLSSSDNQSTTLVKYCDTYSYEQLFQRLENLKDSQLQIGENYFIAYNPDNLGVGFSRNNEGIYITFGKIEGEFLFTDERRLDEKEICNTLERVLRDERFHS